MPTVLEEANFDIVIRDIFRGEPALVAKFDKATDIFEQGIPRPGLADRPWMEIGSVTTEFIMKLGNLMDENMTVGVTINVMKFDVRPNVIRLREIMLLVQKVLVRDTRANKTFKMGFDKGEVDWSDLRDNYPQGTVTMLWPVLRAIDPVIS